MRISHLEIGDLGEKLAKTWLTKRGWKVLWANFKARKGGEVDLVCRDRDTLVFVEVKTRTSMEWGRPADAVNADKQKLIIRGALAWLRRLDKPDTHFRFDIVEVLLEEEQLPNLTLIENAFQLPDNVRVS